jgi:predicted transposase YbfD/YdcC
VIWKKNDEMIQRKIWCNTADADYICDKLNVSDCRIAIRLDCEHRSFDGDILSCETHYYLTSLSPNDVSAQQLMSLIRGHWEVENCLHWIKDRCWDEDRHYLRRPGLAAVYASMTNIALGVLRLLDEKSTNLSKSAMRIQWNPKPLLKKMFPKT